MGTFDKLEIVYLNVLRVVILVLATVLLVGALLLTINAAKQLVPDTRTANARKLVASDSLQDFKSEQAGAPAGPTYQYAPDVAASGPERIDSRIKTATESLAGYTSGVKGVQINRAAVERLLSAKQLALPESLQGDYADSLVKLMNTVGKSRDPSLDPDALIDWHYAKFEAAKENAQAQEAGRAVKNAAKSTQGIVMAGAAASAFFLFLVLVFGFVLVKIERNLRDVRVSIQRGRKPLASTV